MPITPTRALSLLASLALLSTLFYSHFTFLDVSIQSTNDATRTRGAMIPPPEPESAFKGGKFFEVLYFTWMNPLMREGSRRPLKLEDLPALPDPERASTAVHRFKEFKQRYSKLWLALLASESSAFSVQFVIATASTLFGLAGPYFLYRITGYIQDPVPGVPVFLFAIAFGAVTGLRALCDNHAWHMARKMSIRIKAVLVNEIYCKSLKRIPSGGAADSGEKKENEGKEGEDEEDDASVGKIVSLMSTDAETIRDSLPELYDIVLMPLHIASAVAGLLYVVGWPALAGLAVMVFSLPLTYWNSKWNIRVYEKLMAAKDGRTNVVNEVLQGIRIIKYFAWEKKFLEKINQARDKEMRTLIEMYLNGAANTFIWLMTPLIVSFVTLTTLTKVAGKELDAQLAFTCLSLFNSLRIPLMVLPYIISDVFQLKVAFRRITKFLDQEELEKYVDVEGKKQADSEGDVAIGFKAGWYKWYSGDEKTVKVEEATERTPLLAASASSASLSTMTAPVSAVNTAFTLRDLNVNFPVGALSVIVGPTGSGKSSLLQALLGEMKRLQGSSHLPASVAYVAQTSWLQNETIRNNILFGEPYDAVRYDQVIKACALVKDLETLEAGDLTEIGEKGINLSGGQKQRVSLARAVYSSASVILLDDPLSAVDAPTAKWLFEKAICGPLLKGRTRVLVTHATGLVLRGKQVKYMVAVSSGSLLGAGPVRDVVRIPGVAAVVGVESGDGSGELEKKASSSSLNTVFAHDSDSSDEEESDVMEEVDVAALKDYANGKTAESAKLIDTEANATGATKLKYYALYLGRAGGIIFLGLLMLFNASDRGIMIFNDYWLKLWADAYEAVKGNGTTTLGGGAMFGSLAMNQGVGWTDALVSSKSMFGVLQASVQTSAINVLNVGETGVDVDYYIRIYALISCVWVCAFLTAFAVRSWGSYRASKKFHSVLIERIIYAPMRFFDTTPIGRILNRATKDISVIDNGVMRNFEEFIGTIFDALAVLSVVVAVTPTFLITLFPILFIYYSVSSKFLATQREIKRLDSSTRSPIYSMFSETLVGVSTIRAYGSEQRFMTENLDRVDTNHRAFFYMWAANRWFGTRISTIASLVILISAVGTVAMRDVIGAGLAGLSLTWTLSLTDYLVWIVRIQAQLEMNMNAVERVAEYSEIEQERPAVIEGSRPPSNWPSKGSLSVQGLEMRYAPDQPAVLSDVSFQVQGGEKVGIVGRTGAGKSSLSLSLFRIVEPSQGTISIDGIDISTLGLFDLRSKITMIPQDPILFAGTIRSNLDPFNEYDDATLWTSLKQVRFLESMQSLSSKETSGGKMEKSNSEATLDETASEMSESTRTGVTLEAAVAEGGNNFSQGQRQLLCLARALLKSSTLTVFDEATASVDNETDANIQLAMRGPSFAGKTLLVIAHRLRTVCDYDKILVLEKGRVAQFGTPLELMQQEGIFQNMCKDSGEYDYLMEMAR
ncbi:P-loop containing nucleoside triphosphate hydrolase protein, partial [Rhizoclosmatium globosum]